MQSGAMSIAKPTWRNLEGMKYMEKEKNKEYKNKKKRPEDVKCKERKKENKEN